MKKIDYTKVCEEFNKLRINHLHQKFSSEEMRILLREAGINTHIFNEISKMDQFFHRRREGKKIMYKFKSEPVFKDLFAKVYADYNKSLKPVKPTISREEEAVSYLKGLGYRIIKPVGIDTEALQKEYPHLFKKYLIEEEL